VTVNSKEGIDAMSNAMLGPPQAVAGGAVTGHGGSGVFSSKDSAAVGEEFMALVAGLLAGLVPGTQPQAQTPFAPGPNDGKVLQETGTDSAGLVLPQGLAEQAAAAAGVARAVVTVDPQATGPFSQSGLLHAHGEQGLRLEGSWTQNQGATHARAMDSAIVAPQADGSAAVSFTIMPVGTAQVVADPAAPAPVPVLAQAMAPAAAVVATEGEVTTTPIPSAPLAVVDTPEAGTASQGDASQDGDQPKAPASGVPMQVPVVAEDNAAPVTTTSVAGTADEVEMDDEPVAPPPAPSTAPTERAKDVGAAQRVLPAHSPTQLAHELVDHLRVAVREEGREIQITLRPAELGTMTIRVTMQDGVLQAHIMADRPESARLLEQSLRHLEDMLADRGYEMGSVDVNSGGHDARQAAQSAHDAHDHDDHRHGRGRDHNDNDANVDAGSAPAAVVVHDGDVNLLA
jgi:flagellar hook-length control protein FliK